MVGRGVLAQLGQRLARMAKGRTVIITDETVAALHGPAAMASLDAAGIKARLLTVPPGEGSKSFAELERVLDRLIAFGLDRRDLVVALGGGVVGDLAGLAAALFMRGIDFVQVRRPFWPRSIPPSAARRRLIPHAARIWSGRSISRGWSWPTSTCWPPCRSGTCARAGPRC